MNCSSSKRVERQIEQHPHDCSAMRSVLKGAEHNPCADEVRQQIAQPRYQADETVETNRNGADLNG